MEHTREQYIEAVTEIRKRCTDLRLDLTESSLVLQPGDEPTESDWEKLESIRAVFDDCQSTEPPTTQEAPRRQHRATVPRPWLPAFVVAFSFLAVAFWLGAGPRPKTVRRPPPLVHSETLNVNFSLIPGGEFRVGSSLEEQALVSGHLKGAAIDRVATETLHTETVSDFYMAKTEVTVRQFRQFIAETGWVVSSDEFPGIGMSDGEFVRGDEFNWESLGEIEPDDRHPAVNVSWRDAVAFAEWLSDKEGVRYRLPTEAEWERAAQSPWRSRWQTGNDPAQARDVAWSAFNGERRPHPVGQKPPNQHGLHDMHGNVWEWCLDHVDERRPNRVMRGGSYRTSIWMARSAARASVGEKYIGAAVGFRLVRELTP